jgi:hypothetical protein
LEVHIAGEGRMDLMALRRLLRDAGLTPGRSLWGETSTGKQGMAGRFRGWAAGAAFGPPIIALRDLDKDASCPSDLRLRLAPPPTPGFLLRIAVRSVDAWLLADRDRLAAHIAVRPTHLPPDPESCADPKAALCEAARRSSRRAIREGLPPREGSGRRQGPDYVDVLGEFIASKWSPAEAAARSESLRRAMARIEQLRETHRP